jgi:membrane-bound ClpP family serine protease
MTLPITVAIIFAAAFIIFIVYAIEKDLRRKVVTGVEEVIGKEAVMQTTLNLKGTVLAQGELWTA